jgi:dipeptidyl aminopeptidase/acylaminoacyl peptidase
MKRCLDRLFIAIVLPLLAVHLTAQGRRPMTLVDLREVPSVLDPQLAPDGRAVLYQLNQVDWRANRRPGHIWRQDGVGAAAVQLTFADAGESSPRWSPDGALILFLRQGQLFLLPASGGQERALSRHATGVFNPTWSPDGTFVYFLASDPQTSEERARAQARDDVYAFDETYKHRHLWRLAVATGAEQQVTQGDFSVTSYHLSSDGRRIAVHRARSPLLLDSEQTEIWMMDANGEHAAQLTQNRIEETQAEISPDGAQVLFLADTNQRFEPYHTNTLFVVPARGGTPRLLLPEFPYWIDRAAWSPDGQSIYAVAHMGVHSEIFQIDVAMRTARQLTDGRHSIPPAPAPVWSLVASAGRMVFQFDEPTRFGDVWTLDLKPGATPVRVTNVYDHLEKRFRLPRQERIVWKSTDGISIEGLVFYPLDYEPGRRYPLIVQLHGGPWDADRFGFWGWSDYVQVLTARGYVVLRPNYRGSIGYGNAFYRDMVGGFFTHAQLDVLAGVDALVKQGVADPDRLGLTGFSAGAHLVNKLITMTPRFKAAASFAGASNWISLYAQSDLRGNRTLWFGGTPWQKDAPIDRYWNQSPLKDVASVRTPTIFLVGENDTRVGLAQALEMYRALKANGVPTRLEVAPREPHIWLEPRHQLFKANVELDWLERYVMGRSYVWEKSPAEGESDKPKS